MGIRFISRTPNGGLVKHDTGSQAVSDSAQTFERPAADRLAPSFGPFPPSSPRRPAVERDLTAVLAGYKGLSCFVRPHAFEHAPNNTCYRNSVMALLMNIDPFVNWLLMNFRRAAYPTPDTVMSHLAHVAEIYWDPASRKDERGRKQSLAVFWSYFTTGGPNLSNPWGSSSGTAGVTRQNDPNDLLNHIFENAQPQLKRDQVQVLRRLFGSVKLTQTYCQHERRNVRHGSYEDWRNDFPIYRIGFRSKRPTNLEECFRANLISDLEKWKCPRCTRISTYGYQSTRFRELPEVLLIQLQRADGAGGVDTTRCYIPETLDLTDCLFDEDQLEGQHSSYKLIGVVAHFGTWDSGHEIAYIRGADDQWYPVDDMADSGIGVSCSFDEINDHRRYVPVLMAYEKNETNVVSERLAARTSETVVGMPIFGNVSPMSRAKTSSAKNSPSRNSPLKVSLAKATQPEISPPKTSPRNASQRENPSEPATLEEAKTSPKSLTSREPVELLASQYDERSDNELRAIYLERGFILHGKQKKPRALYIRDLLRDDMGLTPEHEKTKRWWLQELKDRKQDPTGLHTKEALRKVKAFDKGNAKEETKKSSTSAAKQPEDKPDKPGYGTKAPGYRKRGRQPLEKEDTVSNKKPTANSQKKSNKDSMKQAGKCPTIQGNNIEFPQSVPDSDRFTISTTLQVLGKGSQRAPDPLIYTWALPTSYDPAHDLNVICFLAVSAPGGQKTHYSIDVSSDRRIFHLDSLASAGKKRKSPPPPDPSDDAPSQPKKPTTKLSPSSATLGNGPKSSKKPIRKLTITHKAAERDSGQPCNLPVEKTRHDTPVAPTTKSTASVDSG